MTTRPSTPDHIDALIARLRAAIDDLQQGREISPESLEIVMESVDLARLQQRLAEIDSACASAEHRSRHLHVVR